LELYTLTEVQQFPTSISYAVLNSCTWQVRGITQHYKRMTHGRVKEGKFWTCIHWRKCSCFQYQYWSTC
jgi:hypothetical protein